MYVCVSVCVLFMCVCIMFMCVCHCHSVLEGRGCVWMHACAWRALCSLCHGHRRACRMRASSTGHMQRQGCRQSSTQGRHTPKSTQPPALTLTKICMVALLFNKQRPITGSFSLLRPVWHFLGVTCKFKLVACTARPALEQLSTEV